MTTGGWDTAVTITRHHLLPCMQMMLLRLMTALGYDSMNVYGVSMGSSVSQQLVIDHPERVRKLVLDSITYSIRIPETKKLLRDY